MCEIGSGGSLRVVGPPSADDDNRITMREMLRLRLEAKSAEVTRLKDRCSDYSEKCDTVWASPSSLFALEHLSLGEFRSDCASLTVPLSPTDGGGHPAAEGGDVVRHGGVSGADRDLHRGGLADQSLTPFPFP